MIGSLVICVDVNFNTLRSIGRRASLQAPILIFKTLSISYQDPSVSRPLCRVSEFY
jgi:hypothetical protein